MSKCRQIPTNHMLLQFEIAASDKFMNECIWMYKFIVKQAEKNKSVERCMGKKIQIYGLKLMLW